MIFVTVGNATQSFLRLLEAIDRLAGEGALHGETVVLQTGFAQGFRALNCKQVNFLQAEQYAKLIDEAEVIICHGGAGSLWHAFSCGKVPVVMPRRKRYGEHVEDQLELVKTIAAEGRVIPAYEPDDLPMAIAEAFKRNKKREGSGVLGEGKDSQMLELVSKAIEELMAVRR